MAAAAEATRKSAPLDPRLERTYEVVGDLTGLDAITFTCLNHWTWQLLGRSLGLSSQTTMALRQGRNAWLWADDCKTYPSLVKFGIGTVTANRVFDVLDPDMVDDAARILLITRRVADYVKAHHDFMDVVAELGYTASSLEVGEAWDDQRQRLARPVEGWLDWVLLKCEAVRAFVSKEVSKGAIDGAKVFACAGEVHMRLWDIQVAFRLDEASLEYARNGIFVNFLVTYEGLAGLFQRTEGGCTVGESLGKVMATHLGAASGTIAGVTAWLGGQAPKVVAYEASAASSSSSSGGTTHS